MRISVKIESKSICILFILLIIACRKAPVERFQKADYDLYFLDVVGDSEIDTLVVKNSSKIKYNKIISILSKNKKNFICEVTPRVDSSYIKTSPPIENIHLEANAIQTASKGFRIVSRNTDIEPEYFFIDLYFKSDWIIKQVGFLNINTENSIICERSIEKNIKDFNQSQVNPKEINQIYFQGTYCQ